MGMMYVLVTMCNIGHREWRQGCKACVPNSECPMLQIDTNTVQSVLGHLQILVKSVKEWNQVLIAICSIVLPPDTTCVALSVALPYRYEPLLL
jgi:hypothetical protein